MAVVGIIMPLPKDVFIIIFGTCKCILLGSKGEMKVANRTKIVSQLILMSTDHSGLAPGSKESTEALGSIRGWQKKRERCDHTRLSSRNPDEEREKRLDEQRGSRQINSNGDGTAVKRVAGTGTNMNSHGSSRNLSLSSS